MLKNPKSTDLQDAQAPEDVEIILRNAAEKFRESEGELAAMWGDPNAGRVWRKIANRIETCGTVCARLAKGE